MKIVLFASAWGEYKDLLKDYALPSVLPSIQWLKEEVHEVENRFYIHDELERFPEQICHDITDCISYCIKNDAYLFLLMPDTIYGGETLYNVAKFAEHRKIYVAWPHFRFDWEDVVKAELEFPLYNEQLIHTLWPYPHQTTRYADMDKEANLCRSRQSARNVGHYTVVNHCYPTIYYFKPDNGDYEIWREKRLRKDWIWYDTGFFSYAVMTKRCRIIGSSDIAFCGELEKKDSHNCALKPRSYEDRCDHGRGDYSDWMLMTSYVISRNMTW